VTDVQTDKQTDGQVIAYSALSIRATCCRALKIVVVCHIGADYQKSQSMLLSPLLSSSPFIHSTSFPSLLCPLLFLEVGPLKIQLGGLRSAVSSADRSVRAQTPKHIYYTVHLKTAFSEYNFCSFQGNEKIKCDHESYMLQIQSKKFYYQTTYFESLFNDVSQCMCNNCAL